MLGVDHFGKNIEAGTRGASPRRAAGDLVLACLGDKELSGSVTNTRLAVRKNRGGQQGQEYPFVLRVVEAPEPDEDGEPITTMVVDWQPQRTGGSAAGRDRSVGGMPAPRSTHGGAAAEAGADGRSWPSRASICRSSRTGRRCGWSIRSWCGSSSMPARRRRAPRSRSGISGASKFMRALDWAEDQQLIAVQEIDDVTYLRLSPAAGGGGANKHPHFSAPIGTEVRMRIEGWILTTIN